MVKLTFDELVALHKRSPEEFDEYHRAVLQETIEEIACGAETRRRKLNALQWKIDNLKRKYKNPTAWNNKLHAMMFEELGKLNEALKQLVRKP